MGDVRTRTKERMPVKRQESRYLGVSRRRDPDGAGVATDAKSANLFRNSGIPAWVREGESQPPAWDPESRQQRAARLGVPRRYWSARFDDFLPDDFAHEKPDFDNYDLGSDGVLIAGDVGRGKTHLAAALAVHVGAQFVKARELVARVQATMCPASRETSLAVQAEYTDPAVLCLDDLTAVHCTDWVLNVILAVLDRRHDDLKPTIATCYQGPDVLDALNRSIRSRVGAYRRIVLVGPDRRAR